MNTAGARTLALSSPPPSTISSPPDDCSASSRMPAGLATGVDLEARMSASGPRFQVAVGRLLAARRPMTRTLISMPLCRSLLQGVRSGARLQTGISRVGSNTAVALLLTESWSALPSQSVQILIQRDHVDGEMPRRGHAR